MPADPRSAPPADWYVDLEDLTRGRYWDGAGWTDDVVDIPDGLALKVFPLRSARRQRQSRYRAVLVAASVVALLATVGVAGWWATGSDDDVPTSVAGTAVVRLRGSVDLEDPAFIGRDAGAPCAGSGALDDLGAGLAVTVRAGGMTVDVSRLRPGRLEAPESDLPDELGALIPTCRFAFECEVPDLAVYEIEIDGYGSQTWTRDDLEAAGWTARMTVSG